LVALTRSGALAFDSLYVGLGVVTALAFVVALIAVRHRNPAVFLGLLFALWSFLPVSNLLPTRLRCFFFERYLMLPHLGLLLAGVAMLREKKRGVRRAYVGGVLLVLVLGYRSSERALDYADATRFWRHEVDVNPTSSVAPAALLSLGDDPIEQYQWAKRCESNASARGQGREVRSCQLGGLELVLGNSPDASEGMLSSVRRELMRLGGTEQVRTQPGRVEAALAIVESRLQNHVQAVAAARRSLLACSTCGWVPPLGFVLAAAGDYVGAHAALGALQGGPFAAVASEFDGAIQSSEEWANKGTEAEGPRKTYAQAQRFLAIGRYESAYQVLLPAELAIAEEPELADDLAMIAFRAGHRAVARRLLLRHRTTNDVERMMSKGEMGSTSLSPFYAP
jgi:hypothetical protein